MSSSRWVPAYTCRYYDLWTLRSKELGLDYDCHVGDACVHDPRAPARLRCDRNATYWWGGAATCSCPAGLAQVRSTVENRPRRRRSRGSAPPFDLGGTAAAPSFTSVAGVLIAA